MPMKKKLNVKEIGCKICKESKSRPGLCRKNCNQIKK